MVSRHAGRNQAAARWHRLDQHPARMVSGQEDRNQPTIKSSASRAFTPQWCPACEAGIRVTFRVATADASGPQWCPAGKAGISNECADIVEMLGRPQRWPAGKAGISFTITTEGMIVG